MALAPRLGLVLDVRVDDGDASRGYSSSRSRRRTWPRWLRIWWRRERFSFTIPSDAAKNASTFLTKNFSSSVSFSQSCMSPPRSTSSAVQKLACDFLYHRHDSAHSIGKTTYRPGFSCRMGSLRSSRLSVVHAGAAAAFRRTSSSTLSATFSLRSRASSARSSPDPPPCFAARSGRARAAAEGLETLLIDEDRRSYPGCQTSTKPSRVHTSTLAARASTTLRASRVVERLELGKLRQERADGPLPDSRLVVRVKVEPAVAHALDLALRRGPRRVAGLDKVVRDLIAEQQGGARAPW